MRWRVFIVMIALWVPIVGAREDTSLLDANRTVKADIERTLHAEPSLDDSRIIVKSVNGGDVLLGGTATSIGDIIQALRLTAARQGVRRVFSDIEADESLRIIRRPARGQLAA